MRASTERQIDRVRPQKCPDCGYWPSQCLTCGDFACRCPVPWLVLTPQDKAKGKKPEKYIPRQHYDHDGKPYKSAFLDGYVQESYPTAEEESKWLIEGGFKP